MKEFVIRLFIFVPVFFGCVSWALNFTEKVPATLLIMMSIGLPICFYHALDSLMKSKMVNQYIGCRIQLQNGDYSCSCGASANMFIIETESSETRVVIQCSDTSCCCSIQAYTITEASNGWNAIS